MKAKNDASSVKPKALFLKLRNLLRRRSIGAASPTAHHSGGNEDLKWEAINQDTQLVRLNSEVFQIQLYLERHETTSEQRVIMFGRRHDPPSTALSPNTQRATFNSNNVGQWGFYVRPQISKKRPAIPRALATEFPSASGLPFWRKGRIQLGMSTPGTMLSRFLRATSALEEIKGTPEDDLARRYPPVDDYTRADIEALEAITEDKVMDLKRRVRERSSRLRAYVANYYSKRARDGRLHCYVDGWAPSLPVNGSIVEIHHDRSLSSLPEHGTTISQEEILSYLFPLCPNCHRMLHSKPGGGSYTVQELRKLFRKGRSR